MKQKVKFFQNEDSYDLQKEINEFAKTHNIESVSYSVCKFGYSAFHYCCVLYTDKSN